VAKECIPLKHKLRKRFPLESTKIEEKRHSFTNVSDIEDVEKFYVSRWLERNFKI